MNIVLNSWEIEAALLEYIKKQLGAEKDFAYTEVFSSKPIKKNILLENQDVELTVFVEVEK